jgi:hypothetical protein
VTLFPARFVSVNYDTTRGPVLLYGLESAACALIQFSQSAHAVGSGLSEQVVTESRENQRSKLSSAASPSSGEVWSWDCGPESVSGHPTSATTSSHPMCATNFGPGSRRRRRELRKLARLYLMTYRSDGKLAGMAVVSAESEADARLHVVSGVGDVSLHQVHTLDPESAAAVTERLLGRVLSRTEATKLLHRIAHAVGQV